MKKKKNHIKNVWISSRLTKNEDQIECNDGVADQSVIDNNEEIQNGEQSNSLSSSSNSDSSNDDDEMPLDDENDSESDSEENNQYIASQKEILSLSVAIRKYDRKIFRYNYQNNGKIKTFIFYFWLSLKTLFS